MAVVSWLLGAPALARADFVDGLAAFDAGDYATSFEEWAPLAREGDTAAQVALAGLYMAGQGVRASVAEALRWYRAAAERGDPVARLNLGDLYDRGMGVARDPVAAYVWFALAAESGRAWPATRRDALHARMSPAQRAEARQRLKAWHEAH